MVELGNDFELELAYAAEVKVEEQCAGFGFVDIASEDEVADIEEFAYIVNEVGRDKIGVEAEHGNKIVAEEVDGLGVEGEFVSAG